MEEAGRVAAIHVCIACGRSIFSPRTRSILGTVRRLKRRRIGGLAINGFFSLQIRNSRTTIRGAIGRMTRSLLIGFGVRACGFRILRTGWVGVTIVRFPNSGYSVSLCSTLRSIYGTSIRCISRGTADLSNFSTIVLPKNFSCNSCLQTNTVTQFTGIVPTIVGLTGRNGPIFNAYGNFRVLARTNLLPNTLGGGSDRGFIYRAIPLRIIGGGALFAARCRTRRHVTLPVTRNRNDCCTSRGALSRLRTGRRIIFHCTDRGPGNSLHGVTKVIGGHNGMLNVVPRPRHTMRTLLNSASNLQLFGSLLRGNAIGARTWLR